MRLIETIKLSTILLVLISFIGSPPVFAEDDDEPVLGDTSNSYDFQKLGGMADRLTPHGTDLMGDMIDKNTGGITFQHTDVSIPGNSLLEVALRRKITQGDPRYTPNQHAFSDWVLDIPIAYTMFAPNLHFGVLTPTFDDGCLIDYGPMRLDNKLLGNGVDVRWPTFTSGVTLNIPGQNVSGFEADPKTPRNPQANWVAGGNSVDHANRCATVVIAPDGTKYKFGRHVYREAKSFQAPYFEASPGGTYQHQGFISRKYAVYLITEVEDVHGNWVRYEYTNDDRAELTRIHSNDLREITLTYEAVQPPPARNSRRVTSITSHGRDWTYEYADDVHLSKVVLPDNRFWEFGDTGFGLDTMRFEPQVNYKCLPIDQTFSLTHPDGAVGTFRIFETRHIKGASNLGSSDDDFDHHMEAQNIPFVTDNSECAGNINQPAFSRPLAWPIYRVLSIKSKTISGGDIPTSTWNYEYRNYSGGSLDENWTKITDPDGTLHTYIHQAVGLDHGLLTSMDVSGLDGTSETFDYQYNVTAPVDPGCEAGGDYGDSAGVCHAHKKRPRTKVTHVRNNQTYTTETIYNQNGSGNFIDYGFPNTVTNYSTLTGSTEPRVVVTTYEHKIPENILGLRKTLVRNGRQLAEFFYNSLGQKISQTRYGHPHATFTYHTTSPYKGALHTVTDALGRVVTRTNYKRGIPQSTQRPDLRWLYVTIDDNGWMTDHTDAKGYKTIYDRDSMGRLELINPPGTWENTVVTYDFTNGGAIQTITKGDSRETVTYDEMYRPILVRSQALDTNWSSYVNTSYDNMGRMSFESQPSTSATETKGMDYTYDGLGRIYDVRENVAPYALTKYRYYNIDAQRQVTDPSGATRVYYPYGYDGPNSDDYRRILRFKDVDIGQETIIYKDVHGQISRIRQRGNEEAIYTGDRSRYFYYNSQQELCREYHDQEGATLYQYDVAGQMIRYAKGQSNMGCGDVPKSQAVVVQQYDLLGRPTITKFSDGYTPTITKTYDDNSNLESVTRTGGIHNGNNSWNYDYNEINLPKHEHFNINGRDYDIDYVYNTSGFVTQKTLPSGRQISFTPDGLGRSTLIKNGTANLATGITYHANSAVAAMNYANGQNFSQTLNDRLLPERLLSMKPGQVAIDQTLSYDARGKITTMTDAAVTSNSRTYGYDGLGRLTTATGPWGSGSFTYNILDDLLQKTLGSRTVTLSYDSSGRVSQSVDTGSSGTRVVEYDPRGNVTRLGSLWFNYDYTDQPNAVMGSAAGNYIYDGNLKRVRSVHNGKYIYYVYDLSGNLVHIDATTEGKTTDYVRGPYGNLVRITNNVVTYLHPDHLGSAQSGTNSSGNVQWRQRYTPFGEKIASTTADDDQAGFTGHVKDKATGLNYMQARYYDPIISRFLSIDPVSFTDNLKPSQVNRYAYTYNDPVNAIDPDGRETTRFRQDFSSNIQNAEFKEAGRVTVTAGVSKTHAGNGGSVTTDGESLKGSVKVRAKGVGGSVTTDGENASASVSVKKAGVIVSGSVSTNGDWNVKAGRYIGNETASVSGAGVANSDGDVGVEVGATVGQANAAVKATANGPNIVHNVMETIKSANQALVDYSEDVLEQLTPP